MEKLDYLDYGEEADDIWELNQMEWLSPKRLAELKEKYRENPPSPEQDQQIMEFLKMLAADSEEKRRKRSGK